MSEGFAALDPCVHCGFCLPACPTFLATGDEADSPRGRIVLMRALERGEIDADDAALREHLDACLGCRGCEPVCPSGVEYGRGLETARALLAERGGLPAKARAVLGLFRHRYLWWPIFTAARLLRATGIPRRLAGSGPTAFNLAMLAATRPAALPRQFNHRQPVAGTLENRTVMLFRGCVMDRLFAHVHEATRRTLEVNGYTVVESTLPYCCGALHQHAGDRPAAEALARANIAGAGRVDFIAVNSAGCGAMLKSYGHLLGGDQAKAFAARVRDISQLLAAAGPRAGGRLDMTIVYDAPCHLQHAQGIQAEALSMLTAIGGARIVVLPGSDRCCGSAGIYSLLQPAMSRAVLDAKIESIARAEPRPDVIATGNPGCLMQIGAGLLVAGLNIPVAHPVELLDRSYQAAGFYERPG